ncbi:response regulator [Paraburkholderia lycopersici]|nr:response regulator [Paraburkholderia lycopersici]
MSRVLLVDDDAAFRDALQARLDDAGYDITTAANGLEMVTAALGVTPDVIVSDIHMPVLEGPDAACMLRAIPRFCGVSVILMSGDEASAGITADGFLRKAFDPGVLLDALASLPERKNAQSASATLKSGNPIFRTREIGAAPAALRRQHQCISRALELVAEQERRISGLEQRGFETALAIEVYGTLVRSVATLTRFERAAPGPVLSSSS